MDNNLDSTSQPVPVPQPSTPPTPVPTPAPQSAPAHSADKSNLLTIIALGVGALGLILGIIGIVIGLSASSTANTANDSVTALQQRFDKASDEWGLEATYDNDDDYLDNGDIPEEDEPTEDEATDEQ